MNLLVVGSAYAIWLAAMNVVFYLVHGAGMNAQEASVLAGVVPMGLQVLFMGFDPVGLMRPARMMAVFVLIALMSYLFNGAGWVAVVYVVELLYLAVLTVLIAGCRDRRLLATIATIYSVPTAVFLLYIDRYGEYQWGRLVAGGLESNAWGLFGLSLAVASFAHRSRLVGAFCLAIGCLTIYDASSRSAIVGLALASLLIGARFLFEQRNRKFIGGIAVCAVILTVAVLLVPYLRDTVPGFLIDLLKLDDPNRGIGKGATGRDDLWRAAIDLWWNHPLFGVGFRMHEIFMPLNFSAHNAYIAMLADTGLFGFLWYMVLLIAAWIGMFRLPDPRTRKLAIGLIASYTMVGLFERRAINGANPMSLMFLMACMVILRDSSLEGMRRMAERRRAIRPAMVPHRPAPAALIGAGGRAAS